MKNRFLAVALIFMTVCCGPSSALDRNANNVFGSRSGRLRRRNERQREHKEEKRQAKENRIAEEVATANEVDYVARKLQTEPLSCNSIIARAELRLRQLNSSGIQYYEVADPIIPYKASPQTVTDESFLCELSNGAFADIKGTHEQYTEMRKMLNNGTLISAESKVKLEVERVPAIVTAEGIPSSSSVDDVVVTLPSGGITIIDGLGDASTRRRLGRFDGERRILLVRVTDVDGRAVPEDADAISDKFFGTYGDTVTVKSGFAGCSFGDMEITYEYGTTKYDSLLSAPGVLDITIGLALTTSTQSSIVHAASKAAMAKLNVGLPGPFAHVIFILEGCYTSDDECQFAAYGYINHWLLITIDDNWKYPAVVMHELGHNLNMGHSGGLDGGSYTDHTCLMGNPLFSDDVGKMCFNAVKNFQIAQGNGGWYTADTDVAFFNSGTTGGTSWRGRLIGVADYAKNPFNHPIILKLETGTGSDYFVSFNRATGVNSEVQEASDQVLIHQVEGGHGTEYSQSMLMTTLYEGRTGTIENWRESGIDLTVKAIEINLSSSPVYAEVLIKFGQQTTTTTTSTASSSSRVTFDSGTTSSTSWSGYIAEEGSDFDGSDFPTRVYLYTESSKKLYLEYKDETLYFQAKSSTGDVYTMGTIPVGGSELVLNWRYTGYGLAIEVQETDYTSEFARVKLLFKP